MSLNRRAAILSLPVLLAACSGSGGGAQSTPQSLAAAVYDDLHAGEFAKICDLVLPDARHRFADAGTDCQTYFGKKYNPSVRAGFADVKVDAKAVQVNGDTAVVPESALTFSGHPSSDGDVTVALRDGKWFVSS